MGKLSTKQKGDISELRVIAELTRMGIDVYCPYGENTRTDLIADTGDELLKVQVKTARNIDDSVIVFNCNSTRVNCSGTSVENYQGDIDGFAVFHPDTELLFYISIEEAAKTEMHIRLEKADVQIPAMNMDEDYQLERILSDSL